MTDSTYTHLAVVADRSGSMGSIEKDMNGGLEDFLTTQAKEPGTLTVDITTFDSTVERVVSFGAVSDVKFPVIIPRGMTALNDGIGITVQKLGENLTKLPEERRPGKVIVLVITDGGENASREYTTEQVKKIVEKQQSEFQWEFIFLGANIDSFSVAGSYGIASGSTIQYDASSLGAQNVVAAASAYVTRTRSGLDTSFTDAERNSTISTLV